MALKQPGQVWGQVAKIMGYRSLGAMKHDLKRTSKAMDEVSRPLAKAEKPQKAEQLEKPAKPEKPEKIEKPERPEEARR